MNLKGRKNSWKHPGNVDTFVVHLIHEPCNMNQCTIKNGLGYYFSTAIIYIHTRMQKKK
jgi:hypothetical protein